LVREARSAGVQTIQGYFLPTKKNGMVAEHYEKLGFESVSVDADSRASVWKLDVHSYTSKNRHIKILEPVHG